MDTIFMMPLFIPIVIALIDWAGRILIVKMAIREAQPKQRADILRALGEVTRTSYRVSRRKGT